jgi:hypothetical protein
MDPESTPTATPTEGQEPEGVEGQEPTATPQVTPEAKTYDEAYVRQLRKEAAAQRTKASTAEEALAKLTDRDKTELQRLTEGAAESDKRAASAESKLTRYEVAAERKLDMSAASFLTGETREEIEASADKLSELLATKTEKPPSFDGGARATPPAGQTPADAHNALLLQAIGRTPNP